MVSWRIFCLFLDHKKCSIIQLTCTLTMDIDQLIRLSL
jgi:hypothetical protein